MDLCAILINICNATLRADALISRELNIYCKVKEIKYYLCILFSFIKIYL
jgi:hypothetical protein